MNGAWTWLVIPIVMIPFFFVDTIQPRPPAPPTVKVYVNGQEIPVTTHWSNTKTLQPCVEGSPDCVLSYTYVLPTQ